MEIVLNFELLQKLDLTPNEYCYLFTLYHNTVLYNATNPELEKLQKLGYLKITPEGVDPRNPLKELFSPTVDTFLEFWNTYPLRVGDRILRTASGDTALGKKCRKKYESVVKGNVTKHNHIIACLNVQLREERHRLQYMQSIEVWLNQKTWEKYEHLLHEAKPETEVKYGTELR